jgi:hypothetical protein
MNISNRTFCQLVQGSGLSRCWLNWEIGWLTRWYPGCNLPMLGEQLLVRIYISHTDDEGCGVNWLTSGRSESNVARCWLTVWLPYAKDTMWITVRPALSISSCCFILFFSTKEIFDIIVDYPDSGGALQDLKVVLVTLPRSILDINIRTRRIACSELINVPI